ncbi:MAG: UDP-N-acetylglucosamine 2-epimerase (hydrolyzing) [Phycisphaerae bacterium]|nr:UDP-N-acetylglucosamine 2-epimerase (hydrolyzing) [Phycisphaerae bacterium]
MNADSKHSVAPFVRLGFISTSRADAGIYEPVVRALSENRSRRLTFFAGGTHLCAEFGRTIESIPTWNGVQVVPVAHHVAGDSPVDVASSAARALDAFSRELARSRPDLIFVLGDRTEMLAAALAATIHRIPIAHLHGGESTIGAYDDACRHAITKLAHVHFAALPEYAARIVAMNEAPWRVHAVGAPAVDRLIDYKSSTKAGLTEAVGLDFEQPTVLVVYHVETLSPIGAGEQIARLLGALEQVRCNMLLIGSNADVGHSALRSAVDDFVSRNSRARSVISLSPSQFADAMAHAKALIGNSSAGIIEAASFRLPVVNIGERQMGRVHPANVINSPCESAMIAAAVERAIDPAFRESLADLRNPYGDGRASERIAEIVSKLPAAEILLRKT